MAVMNPGDSGTDPPSSDRVKSADRAILVLEHLAALEKRQSLSVLHRELGIPKSSLHGVLRTLLGRGWVETDESGTLFGLGVRALLVGTTYIDADDVVSRCRETMDLLSRESGETIHLGRFDRAEIVYLATRQSSHYLRTISRVGRRLPVHATAMGKAILSTYPPDQLQQVVSQRLASLTANTITDLEDLQADLEATRERGYAVDNEENTLGLTCFAVALPLQTPAKDAISISVPVARLRPDSRRVELADLLLEVVGSMQPRWGMRDPAI